MADTETSDEQQKLRSSWVEDEEKYSSENWETVSEKIIFRRQTLAVTAPFIITLVRGLNMGYSSTLLPELEKSNFPMTITEADWIASINILALPVGAFICGYTLEKFGRKPSNMISFFLYTLTWLLFLISDNVGMLLTSRFLTGLATGYSTSAAGIYVGEITDPKYRGMFLSIMTTGIALGVLMIHTINTLVDWKTTALISALIPLVCFVTTYFTPESPQWLIKHQKPEEAKKAFYWLRGYSKETEDELHTLLNKEEDVVEKSESKENLFTDLAYWKPMLIITIMGLTFQWSGYHMIVFYSVSLAKQTFGEYEYTITIMMDLVRVIFSVVSCILCKKVNRGPHLFYTGIGGGLCMLCFAILVLYRSAINTVVILSFLLAYVSFTTAGFAQLVGVIGVELFPYRLRGLGIGSLTLVTCLTSFLVIKTSPGIFRTLGLVITYSIYGVSCLVGTIVLYFIVPETKDKKLSEIEDLFKTKAS